MNSLDIVIATPLLYGLIKGFSNGLTKEITGLLSLVLGIYIAVNFSIFLEPHLNGLDNYEQFKPILAFAILFIATIFIVKFIMMVGYGYMLTLVLMILMKILNCSSWI